LIQIYPKRSVAALETIPQLPNTGANDRLTNNLTLHELL
jgi:hypothetical protein